MKRILFYILLIAATALSASASSTLPASETLRFDITYKWGVIHKHAGNVVIKLQTAGDRSTATLYGRTDPWADKFFSVRDTLISTFSHTSMLPTEYQRIAHEDGSYAHDVVRFSRSGHEVTGNTTVTRRKKKETAPTTTTRSLSATGTTVDMLSSLYYLRSLPFASLTPGWHETINIFSGKRKELLKITYKGVENIKTGNTSRRAYHVTFTFTSDGSRKTSEPIDAWISADDTRTPLLIEGSLKIGKVRCIIKSS